MNRYAVIMVVVSFVFGGLIGSPSLAQSPAEQTVLTSVNVLNEIMNVPATSIPQNLLADAHGLAIIPGVIKGGFVVGVRHGRGVVMVRDQQRAWQPPVFVSITGGSIGWQVGLQATDVILVFRTPQSVQGLLNGKFTIGVDAAAAAGPVGRQAAAATDAQLRAEILSYSRSRGLFAGVSLDGSMLQIDQAANQSFYQGTAPPHLANAQTAASLPASAVRLMETVARHTDRTLPSQPALPPRTSAPLADNRVAPGTSEADLRRQLVAASQPLQNLLDEHWKQFLALPAGIGQEADRTDVETLQQTIARFDTVAKDPQFATLAGRPEFKTVHQLLRLYLNARTAAAGSSPLSLPPPPNNQPSNAPAPLLR